MAGMDPFNLARFIAAQDPVLPAVRAELAAGHKRTHWMWFIFPQLAGLGVSAMSQRYAISGLAEAREILCIPAQKLGALDGFETTVVAFTTDIPAFGGAWGEPYLIGPGSIHLAHTSEERIPKVQLVEAIGIYEAMVRRLLTA